MRSNPPFDPRIQPLGLYPNTNIPQAPPIYMQPIIHSPQPPQVNYMSMPHQTHPSPSYPGIVQHQVQQQFVTTQPVRIQRQQGQGQQAQINQAQQPKPMSVIGNQASIQSQKNKVQQQNKQQTIIQNNVQNQQQQQQGYEGQQQQQMKNQQIIMFWEHKFYTILERFQLIFQKVQWIRSEFYNLNNQLKAVDSEEEWNQAKQHHQDFMEQLQQFSQELAGVINQNANLLQQQDGQGNQHNVWRERYFELFEGYKAMQQQLFELKQTGTKQSDPNMKVSEIMANYRELERQYGQVVNQLNQMKQNTNKSHDNNSEKAYRQKLDFAIKQAQKYKETLDQLHKQNQQLVSAMQQLKSEKNHYEALAMQSNIQKNSNIQHDYQQFHRALNQREEEITMLTKQLKELSQKYNYLVQSYNGMEMRLRQEQIQGKNRIKQMQQQIHSRNSQLMQIKVKLHDSELKIKSGNSISEEYQKMLKIRTTELQDRTNQLQRLRNQLNNAINYRRAQPERQIGIPRKDHEEKIRKLQQLFEQKIQSLKQRLKLKQQQSQNTALLNIKIESLDKKNKMLLQEIENLNKDLHTKQKQTIQLKRSTNIQQKYKQLQYRFNRLTEEKQQINSNLIQKNNQIDRLQAQVNQFQERIKNLSENTHVHSAKPLIGQIEELNRIIQSKQGEINKLKATISLKQSSIRQLQNQIEKTKSSLISNQKLHSRQKDALQESIRVSQRRIQQNQKKMRDLQYQFGSIMKKNLQDQIKNLRSQNQQRQQTIIRLQAEQLELRSRLSHFERIRSTHSGDVDELSNRIKQLQSSKYDMIKKVETSYRDVKNKQRQNRQLTDTVRNLQQNVFGLENQLKQNQKLIRQKDKIIDNLQGQLLITNQKFSFLNSEHENLRKKTRSEAEYLQKQSDDLRRKMFEIQHLNGSRKQLKEKLSTQITKIQNQTIQQLKEQKQFLKSQLAIALQQLSNIPNFASSQRKGTSSKKSKASEGIDYIQKRLFDFNSKLDQIILKNKQINVRGFGSNIQNGSSSRINNRQYEEQIKVLKAQIQQLRKYISKLEVEAGNQTIKYNPKNSLIYMEQEKAYNQRMDFYQKQTNQLQGRIQSLIRVNTTLKERIDSLLRDGGSNTNNYYKTQIVISQETIDNLEAKITKLLEQNRNLKSNTNQTTTKMCRDYEGKIFDCENKIFNLERKISSLQLERNRVQNERIVLQRNLNTTQTELSSTKSTTQKQLKTYQTNNKQLTQQIQSLQSTLADLLQKIRIIQSENSRLTQAVNSTYSQQHIILNTPVRDSSNRASTFKR